VSEKGDPRYEHLIGEKLDENCIIFIVIGLILMFFWAWVEERDARNNPPERWESWWGKEAYKSHPGMYHRTRPVLYTGRLTDEEWKKKKTRIVAGEIPCPSCNELNIIIGDDVFEHFCTFSGEFHDSRPKQQKRTATEAEEQAKLLRYDFIKCGVCQMTNCICRCEVCQRANCICEKEIFQPHLVESKIRVEKNKNFERYNKMRVVEIRNELRHRGLILSGNKNDLINRLIESAVLDKEEE
jgi:hypothetical protein